MVRRELQLPRGHRCHHCGIPVEGANEFRVHLQYKCELSKQRIHPGPFVCAHCPAVFVQHRSLKEHIKGHTHAFMAKEKCLICGWGKNGRGAMTKHAAIHK